MRIIASIFLVACSLLSCNTFSDNLKDSTGREISELLDSLVAANEIPGINLSLVLPGGDQYSYSSGFADIESRARLDNTSVMFSGSIGKTYAVVLALQLAEKGLIDLDMLFIDYFPDTGWLLQVPNLDKVTVRMLLSHTSGLPRYVMNPALWDTVSANPDKVWGYRDRLFFIFDEPAVHEPGSGWSYSDSNYILVGMLIEKVTGEPYYEVLKRRVLEPAGLANTYPAVSRNIANLPSGYSDLPIMFHMSSKVVNEGIYAFNPQMEWTGGGMASTTSDLARWAKVYYEGSLVSDTLFNLIITPNSQAPLAEGGEGYGLGSFIYDTRHGIAYGHTGFVPGFNSIFAYFTESNIAMALQSNCDYAAGNIGLMEYLCMILDCLEKNNQL